MNLGFHMRLEEGIGGNGLKGQQLETRLPVGSGLWDSGISTLGKSLFCSGSQGSAYIHQCRIDVIAGLSIH